MDFCLIFDFVDFVRLTFDSVSDFEGVQMPFCFEQNVFRHRHGFESGFAVEPVFEDVTILRRVIDVGRVQRVAFVNEDVRGFRFVGNERNSVLTLPFCRKRQAVRIFFGYGEVHEFSVFVVVAVAHAAVGPFDETMRFGRADDVEAFGGYRGTEFERAGVRRVAVYGCDHFAGFRDENDVILLRFVRRHEGYVFFDDIGIEIDGHSVNLPVHEIVAFFDVVRSVWLTKLGACVHLERIAVLRAAVGVDGNDVLSDPFCVIFFRGVVCEHGFARPKFRSAAVSFGEPAVEAIVFVNRGVRGFLFGYGVAFKHGNVRSFRGFVVGIENDGEAFFPVSVEHRFHFFQNVRELVIFNFCALPVLFGVPAHKFEASAGRILLKLVRADREADVFRCGFVVNVGFLAVAEVENEVALKHPLGLYGEVLRNHGIEIIFASAEIPTRKAIVFSRRISRFCHGVAFVLHYVRNFGAAVFGVEFYGAALHPFCVESYVFLDLILKRYSIILFIGITQIPTIKAVTFSYRYLRI